MPEDENGVGSMWIIAAGVLTVAALIVTATWWIGVDGAIRTVLENSPLTGAVATSPDEDGNPAVVVVVTALLGVILLIAVSRWRQWLAARALRREGSRFTVFAVSLLRTVLLIGTVSLLPVVAGIASASDLEADSESHALTSPWQIAIVAIFLGVYTFLSSGRAFQRALAKLPEVKPVPDGSAG